MQKVIIKDRLYGTHVITESVIIDLLKSKPVQRLKKLNQFGIPDKYYHIKNFSRYEHSLGVMLLIKKLGGGLEEQIAGLLHDVSHSAFSHVFDWVVNEVGGNETHQDSQHESVIGRGEIKEILEKYGYSPKRIPDYHNFTLLEREAPDLCADRVDYALREFSASVSKLLLKSIINKDNEIIFKDQKSAYIFAINFLKLQRQHWGGFEATSRYRIFSKILKQAINEGTISLNDFFKDDVYVTKKLLKTKNPKIKAVLKILSNKKMPILGEKKEVMYKKFRHTDPKFLNGNNVLKLSEADGKYRDFLKKEKLHNQKGMKVPLWYT